MRQITPGITEHMKTFPVMFSTSLRDWWDGTVQIVKKDTLTHSRNALKISDTGNLVFSSINFINFADKTFCGSCGDIHNCIQKRSQTSKVDFLRKKVND